MTEVLNFMGEHPWFSFFLGWLVFACATKAWCATMLAVVALSRAFGRNRKDPS